MEVITANTAGFCFGVKRAVETVYEQIEKHAGEDIYTYGPIIHNAEVIKDLESRGVNVIHDAKELAEIKNGVVIVRSHGVSEQVYNDIKKKASTCVDTTCPFVKKIHSVVKERSAAGEYIIIIGNESHPEVEGITGWAGKDICTIESVQEAQAFSLDETRKICIVAQTTFNYNKFKELVEIISEKGYDISVLNTICSATKERQTEAFKIADEVDAMIVIGDKQSSNTQKLFEICKKACNNTYYIQTLDDLDINQLRSVEKVGITAGASTPNNIIEEVQSHVRVNI